MRKTVADELLAKSGKKVAFKTLQQISDLYRYKYFD
jgi:hypothetical protein